MSEHFDSVSEQKGCFLIKCDMHILDIIQISFLETSKEFCHKLVFQVKFVYTMLKMENL